MSVVCDLGTSGELVRDTVYAGFSLSSDDRGRSRGRSDTPGGDATARAAWSFRNGLASSALKFLSGNAGDNLKLRLAFNKTGDVFDDDGPEMRVQGSCETLAFAANGIGFNIDVSPPQLKLRSTP